MMNPSSVGHLSLSDTNSQVSQTRTLKRSEIRMILHFPSREFACVYMEVTGTNGVVCS